jgi:hypothetical protein
VKDHDGLDVLVPFWIRNPDDRGFLDGFVLLKGALDLGGIDVFGCRLDQSGLRADEGDRAVGFSTTEIVGVMPVACLASLGLRFVTTWPSIPKTAMWKLRAEEPPSWKNDTESG